ncbi:MAG: hypothetical protein Q8T09_21915 [Candidatus Melainabacteria bacterium]|nr:hypothetical protein [Candidatus Melainabacteria bacterium]
MDFILPIVFSIFLAPFVGLGCATITVLCLRALWATKKRPPPRYSWLIAVPVFAICTSVTPFTLVMGWAFTLDAIIDAENKKASSTSSEFWQSFATVEQDLHDIKSENDPAYQKLKLQLDKYVWPSSVVVGARHGNVRELSFKELDVKRYNAMSDSSKLICAFKIYAA